MSRTIPLTQGYVAIVDDEDYEELSQWKWYASREPWNVYACRSVHVKRSDGSRKTIRVHMHRQVLGLPVGDPRYGDHINHNGLDNRSCNLRIASGKDNIGNARCPKGTSRFRGVYWDKRNQRWRANIGLNRKTKALGSYTDEREAAAAWNKAALEYFGEFALLNDLNS